MSLIQYGNACPAILVGLKSVAETGRIDYSTAVGVLQAVMSPQNTQGVTLEQLASNNGHRKQVRIAYRQRQTKADVSDTKSCEIGTPKEWFEDTIDINQYSEIGITFRFSDIRAYCEAFSNWVTSKGSDQSALKIMEDAAMQIMPDLDALRLKIAENAHIALAAGVGPYANGLTSPQTFTMLNDSNGSLNLKGFNAFNRRLAEIGSGIRPLVVGANNIWDAVMAMGYGCCNDGGIDFGVMRAAGAKFDFFIDTSEDFDATYGDDNAFVAWFPKSFQLIPYIKNVGNFAGQIGTMIRGTMPDPLIPGLMYDTQLILDECSQEDPEYTLTIGLHYDFYTKASEFKSGDRLEGVNGIITGIADAV